MKKTDAYRAMFKKYGVDISISDFREKIEKEHGIKGDDVPHSAFYAVKKEFIDAKKEPVAKPVSPPEPPPTPVAPPVVADSSVAVEDLPVLMSEARALLSRFKGNKAALVKFIAGL